MAITAYKTFAAFEVLYASDLNASFTRIINNPIDLWSPMTKNAAAGGFKFTGLGAGSASGEALIYGQAINGTTGTYSSSVAISAASSGAALSYSVENSSNTASSDAKYVATVGGTSAGDAYYVSTVTSGLSWSWGTRNSLSDAWVLSESATLGTNNRITVATGGAVTLVDDLSIISAMSSSDLGLYITNTDATNKGAQVAVTAQSTSTGDASFLCSITGGATVSFGIDNSASDAFVIAASGSLGTSNILSANTSTLAVSLAGSLSISGSSGNVAATTWTPTLTNATNITASTLRSAFYFRIGSYVLAFVKANIDPNVASTGTSLGISLPIASNFAQTYDCIGGAALYTGTAVPANEAHVQADPANDRADFSFRSDAAPTTVDWDIWFAYPII